MQMHKKIQIKKTKDSRIKSEKGSITLFVLVSMMFFLLLLVFAYMNQSDKMSAQKKQIVEIQKQYEPGNIEKIYREVEEKEKSNTNTNQ